MYFKLRHDAIEKLMDCSIVGIKTYLALGSFADFRTGKCWPGYKRLKAMTKCSSGSRLKKALDELVQADLISVEKKGNKNHYVVKKDRWYDEYLQSDEWKAISASVIERDGKCLTCGRKASLVVHHVTYARVGHEELDDLITLCFKCHNRHHNISE